MASSRITGPTPCFEVYLNDPQSTDPNSGNTVNFTLNFAPATGTDLTVVKNTGLSFIVGTFDNLTNGRLDFGVGVGWLREEFQAKLDTNAALKKAFQALTPGRQRAYLFYFAQPKQSATRESRVEKHMPKILKGKGLND